MNETIYPGGPVMIRIDGSKIRRIREQKGFTQLYIATAVAVTTDTVSRWENKRYPTIKQENGIKLAQALEVELKEILETEQETDDKKTAHSEKRGKEPTQTTREDTIKTGSSADRSKRLIVLLCLCLCALIASIVIAVIIFIPPGEDKNTGITVTRTVPPHFIPGMPFPVFIRIDRTSEEPISMILRDNLPPGTELTAALPQASTNKNDHAVQWLSKISGPALFAYSLKTEKSYQGTLHFQGLLKIGISSESRIPVSGDNSSASSLHHWADTNGDNRISDEEILMVYDLTGPEGITGIDMDLLEEIWLGEGYIWQPEKQTFSIIE
ncbi:MAG: hypothetical protein CR981_03020 [Proteobacteria bacterium]|nr:MAG: hypothetical protein CR981_03020 [Pseudomonadota bacterium]